MIELAALLKIVPPWCYWLLAVIALCLGCELHGRGVIQKKWDKQVEQQVAADKQATADRIAENKRIVANQEAINARIIKGYQDEIAQVRSAAARSNAGRLRVSAAICNQPAGSANAESTSGGDATASRTIALPESIANDLHALMVEADSIVAGCRVAQQFIVENGLGE